MNSLLNIGARFASEGLSLAVLYHLKTKTQEVASGHQEKWEGMELKARPPCARVAEKL